MKSDTQLIKHVFGKISIPDHLIQKENFKFNFFSIYKINISETIKGIIDIWYFAVTQEVADIDEETFLFLIFSLWNMMISLRSRQTISETVL